MKALTAAVVAALVAGACGSHSDLYEIPPERGMAAERRIGLPDPVPAVPAFVARLARPAGDDRLAALADTNGVAVAAPVSARVFAVTGPGGTARLRVGATNPLDFRAVAPGPTRDADFVWTALLGGEAVVTFDAARRLGLDEGSEIEIPEFGSVTVGAFADNGTPNVVDVLVGPRIGRDAGFGGPNVVAIGAESGVTLEVLQRELENLLPRARLERLVPQARPGRVRGAAREPVAQASGGIIGTLRFRILDNGFISPDPSWVAANISSGTIPILGAVTCHRLMFPQLRGALEEIDKAGLAGAIRAGDYGGCYVPRFIDRDPRKPLSMHAFGLAIDINVSTNQLGTRGDLDPRVVQIFESWGFRWGGRWSRPDPMHFELARLLNR